MLTRAIAESVVATASRRWRARAPSVVRADRVPTERLVRRVSRAARRRCGLKPGSRLLEECFGAGGRWSASTARTTSWRRARSPPGLARRERDHRRRRGRRRRRRSGDPEPQGRPGGGQRLAHRAWPSAGRSSTAARGRRPRARRPPRSEPRPRPASCARSPTSRPPTHGCLPRRGSDNPWRLPRRSRWQPAASARRTVMTLPAGRRPRRRLQPGPGRSAGRRDPRRPRRDGHQGRATRSRGRHPALGSALDRRHRAPTSRAPTARRSRSSSTSPTPEDLRLAQELAARCDVLIENFRTGSLDRRGLGYEHVAPAIPASSTPPSPGSAVSGGAALAGYDFLVQAVGGLMSITGPGRRADEGRGRARRRADVEGRGRRRCWPRSARVSVPVVVSGVEVNLLSSLLGSLANQASAYLATGEVPGRMGNRHPSIAPYETLAAKDGHLAVCCGNDAQFRRAGAGPGRPRSWRMTHDSRRTPTVSRTGTRSSGGSNCPRRRHGRRLGGAADRCRRPGRQGRFDRRRRSSWPSGSRARSPTVDLGDGRAPQVRNPITFSDTPISGYGAPPRLGQHNDDVRRWLHRRRPPDEHHHPLPPAVRARSTRLASTTCSRADEKAVRASVRQLLRRADRRPTSPAGSSAGGSTTSAAWRRSSARSGVLGMHLEGYGCAGHVRRRVRPGLPGAGGRRLRASGRWSPCRARWRCSRSGAWAAEEQKQEWLPRMAAGEAIGCFGLTEPDVGSDPGCDAHPCPRATATTGCSTAARCGSPTAPSPTSRWCGRRPTRAIRGFVVPTDTPGFSAPEIKHKMSLRASVTSELVLDGVRLPAAAVLPEVRGLEGAARAA